MSSHVLPKFHSIKKIPAQTPWGGSRGGPFPYVEKIHKPYVIRFQTPNTTCIVKYYHCPTLCNTPSHFPEQITSYFPPLMLSQVAKAIPIAAQGIPLVHPKE